MSRIGKIPVAVPAGVTCTIDGTHVHVKGPKGELDRHFSELVTIAQEGEEIVVALVGVGYRAQLKGRDLELALGYSHPVKIAAGEGISFEVPDNTHISVKGISKEKVGQVAADIRAKRPPEPYKGKGIRYEGEHVRRKLGKAAK